MVTYRGFTERIMDAIHSASQIVEFRAYLPNFL
jgi:hypothetical protein